MAAENSIKDSPAKEGNVNFTQRDFQLLASALTCVKGDFAIDYDKFATVGGFKNSNSSKASWHGLKKKLEKMASIEGTSTSAPTTPKSKSASKRKSPVDEDESNINTGDTPSPPKKAKKTPTKATKGSDESSIDHAGEHASTSAKKVKAIPTKHKKAESIVKAESADGDEDVDVEDESPEAEPEQTQVSTKAEHDGDAQAENESEE